MCKVSDCDFVLLFNVGQERAEIVYSERENAVLVGCGECDAEYCAILSSSLGLQFQTVEGGQHAEFKLKFVVGGDLEWHPLIKFVFGDFNIEGLYKILAMS